MLFEPRASPTEEFSQKSFSSMMPRPSSATSSLGGSRGSALLPCRSLLHCPRSAREALSPTWPTPVMPEPESPRQSARVDASLQQAEEQTPVRAPVRQRPTTSPAHWGRGSAGSGCSRCRELGPRVRQLQRELAAYQQARLAADHRAHVATERRDAAVAWQRDLLRGLAELGVELPGHQIEEHVPPASQVVEAVRSLLARSEARFGPAVSSGHHQLAARSVSTIEERWGARGPRGGREIADEPHNARSSPSNDGGSSTGSRRTEQISMRHDEHDLTASVTSETATAHTGAPPPQTSARATAAHSHEVVVATPPPTPPRERKAKAAAAAVSKGSTATTAGLAVARFQLGPMLAKMASTSAADKLRQHAS